MKKILLIEDQADLRENIAEIIELAGYEVICAENGKMGAKKAIEHAPDLVLCDIMMPELDGYGVLHILSRNVQTEHIPFIFLTAKADKKDIREGMRLGADDYITKPFDETDLLETIERRLVKAAKYSKESALSSTNSTGLYASTEAAKKRLLDYFIEKGEKCGLDAKQRLFKEDELVKQLYYVHSGKLKVYALNLNARPFITDLKTSGGFIGMDALFSEERYSNTAEAISDCELYYLDRLSFFELLYRDIDISAFCTKYLAESIKKQTQTNLRIAYESVRLRVLQALLALAELEVKADVELLRQYEEKQLKRVSFSAARDDIAALSATSVESAIRALSQFKDEGLIVIKGKYITIPDLLQLRQEAEY